MRNPSTYKGMVLNTTYRSVSPPRSFSPTASVSPKSTSPTSPTSPGGSRVRRSWTGDELEQLIREKIQERTHGGNGQMLTALRLFGGKASAGGEINPHQFLVSLQKLLNTDIDEEE